MTVWMGTVPIKNDLGEWYCTRRKWEHFFEYYDIHKWIIARETGKGGYRHWQVRFQTSQFDNDEGWEELKEWFKKGHFEKASDTWDYETKDGNYLTSEDNEQKLIQRYGPLLPHQTEVLGLLDQSGDRGIVLWLDPHGRSGKSWLCGALFERRIGMYCPPYLGTVKEIVQFVASGYRGERYIVIDLPRDIKWNSSLYAGVEAIKDGLVADGRYSARTRNIRGVKVLVLANTRPKLDRLSTDRWVIYEPSAQ